MMRMTRMMRGNMRASGLLPIAVMLAIGCGDDIPDGVGTTSTTTGDITGATGTSGGTNTTTAGSLDDTGTDTGTTGEDIDEFPPRRSRSSSTTAASRTSTGRSIST